LNITPNDEKQSGFSLEEWKNKAYDALTDDSPVLIAHLFEVHDGRKRFQRKRFR
jgi:cysteinyl-tRNA synthetase